MAGNAESLGINLTKPGTVYWQEPHTGRHNASEFGHFFVVLYADEEEMIWTSLSSVKDDGRPYDNTCEFNLPAKMLRNQKQTRMHYVCYDRSRKMGVGYVERLRPLGRLPLEIVGNMIDGFTRSTASPRDLKDYFSSDC